MEFWGAEVNSGTPLNVKPGKGMVIHLSQASVAEVKANKNERVSLFVKVGDNKMVLGTLLSDKLPQQQFDLVFDRDFELSHNSKSGSVYFIGYKGENPVQEGDEFDTDDSEPEDLPLLPNNGKPDTKGKQEKPQVAAAAAAGKPKGKLVDNSEDDDSDEDSDEDGTSAGGLMDEDDSSDSQDDDSDSDETPKKVAPSKKRDAESEIKTPVAGKKAKLATPQKTDGKKSGHVATPYPSKQTGKTPANKATQQTPKSGGTHSCGSCNKAFGSENALQSHNKAKHSTGK